MIEKKETVQPKVDAVETTAPAVAPEAKPEAECCGAETCCGEAQAEQTACSYGCDCKKAQEAEDIIRKHVYGAIGVGMVPVPLVDVAGFMGVQLNLIRRLCELYDLPFKEGAAKKVVASLVGGVVPVALTPLAFSLLKMIPVVGYTASAASLAALGGGATYAVGRVFADHFQKGGSPETLSCDAVREDFAKAYESGKTMVKDVVSKTNPEKTAKA